MCQCPAGLNPHFYSEKTPEDRRIVLCQCPAGLNPHFYPTSGSPLIPTVCEADFVNLRANCAKNWHNFRSSQFGHKFIRIECLNAILF